jgi:hypothetical protein
MGEERSLGGSGSTKKKQLKKKERKRKRWSGIESRFDEKFKEK